MGPEAGVEPAPSRLRAEGSATELLRNIGGISHGASAGAIDRRGLPTAQSSHWSAFFGEGLTRSLNSHSLVALNTAG